jgi:pantothenate kinase type III
MPSIDGTLIGSSINLITYALSFAAAIALNNAFIRLFEELYGPRDTAKAQFIFAGILIGLAIFIVWLLLKWKKTYTLK